MATRRRPKPQNTRFGRAGIDYLFVLPAAIVIGVFLLYPIFQDVYLSLTRWDVLSSPHYVGLANFRFLLKDPLFTQAVVNTIYFVAVAVPAQIVLGLILAIILDEQIRLRGFFRLLFFVPMAISFVAAGLIFRWLLASTPVVGFAGQLASDIGLHYPHWDSTNGRWAMPVLILINTWKSAGFVMIVYLTGLQAINPAYYEAAAIDGAASRWQRFRFITWPLLRPTTILLVISTTIFCFQMFTLSAVVTQGGPAGATTTLVYYAYQQFPELAGVGAAAATVLLMIACFVAAVQVVSLRRIPVYS
jgi:ABC-type sugar transport system permease subunit